MKFLIEKTIDTEVLIEGTKEGTKRMYIAGPFLMFDKPNQNNRIYPEKVMDKAVNKYIKEYINENRALGELNHSASLSIDPERACILTTEVVKEGKYWNGKAKVLSSPLGKLLESLIDDGVKFGVSSRGAGSVTKKNGYTYVGEDYNIAAIVDIVTNPSVADAFVTPLMEEKDYVVYNGVLVESDYVDYQNAKKLMKTKEFEDYRLKKFSDIISKISKL